MFSYSGKRRWLILGGSGALLTLCLLIGVLFVAPLVASAHPQDTQPTKNTTNYCDLYTQDLAKQLGITVDKLKQARQGAVEDVLNQMVKDGKLTQSQADQLKQKASASKKGDRCNRFNNAGGLQATLLKKYGNDILTQIAASLKLASADDLKSKLQSGQSLSDIATAQGVSAADLHTDVVNALNSAVDKAGSAGDLTQDQVQTLKQFIQQHGNALDKLFDRQWKAKTHKPATPKK